jgi:tRNA 2-(methylsulfanyl)-N6-isopentenyladenosine37 hydroxylase
LFQRPWPWEIRGAIYTVSHDARFALLASAAGDPELARFYASLQASEAGHHAVFLSLGRMVLPAPQVEGRWHVMLDAEARIIQRQPPGPQIHSGFGKM